MTKTEEDKNLKVLSSMLLEACLKYLESPAEKTKKKMAIAAIELRKYFQRQK